MKLSCNLSLTASDVSKQNTSAAAVLWLAQSSNVPSTATTGTSSFGMSGVNAHAIFAPATAGAAAGERVSAGHFMRHQHWPVVTARHLMGPARIGGRGQLVFACTLRSQELSYLWDHKVC